MFITFEGIDGSGKSTQIELLEEKLDSEGHDVSVFREPGGTKISEQIRSLLLDSPDIIDPVTEILLFSSARSQLIAERVIPLLNQGKIVILDRYYDSTTAYQGYGRKAAEPGQIKKLNELASHRCVPDITFYLRIPLEEAERRKKADKKDRMEQSGKEFYRRVIEGYDRIAREQKRFITIDTTLPLHEVHQMIWDRISGRLE